MAGFFDSMGSSGATASAPSTVASQPAAAGGFFDNMAAAPSPSPIQSSQPSLLSRVGGAMGAVSNFFSPMQSKAPTSLYDQVSQPAQPGVPANFSQSPNPVSIKQPFTVPNEQGNTALAQNVAQQVKDSFQSGADLQAKGTADIQSGHGVMGGLEAELGTATKVYSPIAPLTNLIGTAINFAGSELAKTPYMQSYGKDVANLPPGQQQPPQVLTALSYLGGIAMAILGAKGGDAAEIPPEKIAEAAQHPAVLAAAQKVVEAQKAEPLPEVAKPSSPQISPQDKLGAYLKSQGIEPYTPAEKLPTIEMGAKPKSTLPVVSADSAPNVAHEALPADTRFKALPPEDQATVRTMQKSLFGKGMDWNSAGETALARLEGQKATSGAPLTIEPIKEPTQTAPVTKIAAEPMKALTIGESAPIKSDVPISEKPTGRTTQNLKPIEGTGELKTRGVSQSLEASAIEKNLTEGFGSLPEYQGADFKKISQDVATHIAEDPKAAMDIAMGDKAAPKGSVPEMYLRVLADKATAKGDYETIQRLATQSKLASGATTMGQRIAALGYGKDSLDAVDKVQEVQAARATALKAKGVDMSKEIIKDTATFKKAVKTASVPRQSWEDFAKNILTCKS